jgi:hypothetical protein
MVIGITGGIFGALFNELNKHLTMFRMRCVLLEHYAPSARPHRGHSTVGLIDWSMPLFVFTLLTLDTFESFGPPPLNPFNHS